MALYLLKIQDNSSNWKKIGGYKMINDEQSADFVMDENLYMEVTHNQWTYVKNLIDSGSTITYPASADPLTQDDLVIENVTPLRSSKIRAFSNISHQVNQRLLQNGAVMYIFKFIVNDNILKNAGYIITDDNREQVYLDIINTENDNLISTLEEYLDIRDKLNENLWFFNNFMIFEDRLRSAATVKEVKNLYDIAMSYFD